jgi:Escherichia/Staphylococcus phage prohead protease
LEPGVFRESLKQNSVLPILWAHDTKTPIGWGTARETRDALLFEGRLLIDTAPGRNAYEFMKGAHAAGAKDGVGLSVGFSVDGPNGAYRDNKGIRRFTRCHLREVSVVTFPANSAARVTSVKYEKAGRTISAATAARIRAALDHFRTGIPLLEELVAVQNVYPQDINEPNPVGGGKEYDPLANIEAQKMIGEIEDFLSRISG